MRHVMLDIETLGTKPGCVVLTVGAVAFDPTTGQTSHPFYEAIEFKDAVLTGMVVEPDTYAWWQQQDAEARRQAFAGGQTLDAVVSAFTSWSRGLSVDHWWAQGADFDFPIWEAAIKTSRGKVPWRFWQKRDTRTLYSVAGFDSKNMPRDGTYHNALDDCMHQVRCVHESYRMIGLAHTPVTTMPTPRGPLPVKTSEI